MNKTMLTLLAIVAAAVLAGCEFSVGTTVPYDAEADANTWTGATLAGAPSSAEVTLGPNESIRYRVAIPSSSLDAVYFELDQPLELTVYDASNFPIASSVTADFFERGTLALSAAGRTALGTADVTAQLSCRGSCVIERHRTATRYVKIENPTGFTVTTNLYVVLRDFEDTSESGGTATLGTGTTEGALETLGDVDVYEVGQSGDVELVFGTLASGLDYRLRIYDSQGDLVSTLFEGDPAELVFAGEEVRVDAVDGDDRAGASGKSRYQISLQASTNAAAVDAEAWTGASLVGADSAYAFDLASGESALVRVDVPSTDLDAIYFELDQNLDLRVYDAANSNLIASSSSSDFFGSGELGLSAARLSASDVTAQLSCRGSCVIERTGMTRRHVEITNATGGTVSGNLYAILRDFEDTSESGGTATLGTGTTEGALETLGDVDVYEVGQSGDVELVFGTLASGLDYRLRIYDSQGDLVSTLFEGDPAELVFAGEEVRVDAVDGDDRAGASGKSRYQIAFN